MRLYEIHKQFLQYSKQLDQDWGYVPFVNVHLKSAFLAQNIEDQVTAESLYNLRQHSRQGVSLTSIYLCTLTKNLTSQSAHLNYAVLP